MIYKLYSLIIILILVFIIIKIQIYFKTVENFAYGIECLNNYVYTIQDNTISKQQDGDYDYLKFLHTGGNQTTYTLTLYTDVLCDILIVGGGGGGGNGMGWSWSQKKGAGGGGGGVVYLVNQILNAGTYKINVGRGGNTTPDNGKDSSINYDTNDSYVTLDNITLQGKGGGRGSSQGRENGSNGGSGGGGRAASGTQGLTFWNGTTYEYGGHGVSTRPSSSGGGAGSLADLYAGIGREVNITNESLYFGGGGQGAEIQAVIQGGGGKGGMHKNGSSGFNGMPNTGGGGGGGVGQNGNSNEFPGGSGGSGIVIIRFREDPLYDFYQNIVLWNDSQNIDGQKNTTLYDGQLITDWLDKSESGFTTTSTKAPSFNQSDNALYFNSNTIVTNINFNSYETVNIFFVWKPTENNDQLHGLWNSTAKHYNRNFWIAGPELDWFDPPPAPSRLCAGTGRGSDVDISDPIDDFITNNIYIVNTEYNIEGKPGKAYINNDKKMTFTCGALDGTSDSSSDNYTPSTTFGMAPVDNHADFYMKGNVYEIIIIDRLLTDTERLKIYNYLNNKSRS